MCLKVRLEISKLSWLVHFSQMNWCPYKLAFVLAKHKLPFSTCEAFSEFARSADPSSSVFSQMACSRGTITNKKKSYTR